MKALVLCGGEGTRLRPFTFSQPKHLLPVAGKPVVAHVIRAVREAGIEDVGVVVSPSQEKQFRACLDGAALGVRLTYVSQPEPKGLAHAVLCAGGFLGQEDFLVVLGDNLLERGVQPVVETFRRAHRATVALAWVEDPRRFGVAVLEGEHIVRVVEKPAEPPSPWAIVGVYAFKPSLLEAAQEVQPSWRGELELTDAIQRLVDRGEKVYGFRIGGWWQDIGSAQDLLQANRLLLARLEGDVQGHVDAESQVAGPVWIGPGVKVVRSRILGPARIDGPAWVEDGEIGPHTALGPKVRVHRARIQDSIVMDEAQLENVRLAGSVVGRKALVRDVEHPCSLFLGDMAQVTGLSKEGR